MVSIYPISLRQRLESDPEFAYHELKKDFSSFMEHSTKLSEALQLIHNGKTNGTKDGEMDNIWNKNTGQKPKRKRLSPTTNQMTWTKKEAPICLNPACKAKGVRHYMRDCKATTDQEHKNVLKSHAEEKAKKGPSKSTRAQII